MNRMISLVLTLFLFLALALPAAAADGTEYTRVEEKTYNGIPYLTGGVGTGERADIRDRVKDYNLKLVFALGEAYLGIVDVVVTDAQREDVLKATTDGPWLYTKLSPGTYTVKATARGETKTQKVEVGKKLQEILLTW